MIYDSFRHGRQSIRLRGYDYSSHGAYFVTVCVKDRGHMFGEIRDGGVVLNELGQIVLDSWISLEQRYSYVTLDQWIIMPNHMHGIIVMTSPCRGGSRTAPTEITKRKTLGRLIGVHKTVSTKQINIIRQTPGFPVWQRNYYERIIRNHRELHAIRQYIQDNPTHWNQDPENPQFW